MAIQDENKQMNSGTPMSNALGDAAQRRVNDQNKAQQQASAAGQGFSFLKTRGMARAAMGRTVASESLTKIYKAVSQVLIDNCDKTFEVNVYPIDKEETASLAVSIIIIALQDKTNPDVGIAHHTLVLEATVDQFQPKYESILNEQIEVPRVVGDAADNMMQSVIVERLRRQFPQVKIWDADRCVVPADFKHEDEIAVFKLASNAAFAASSELQRRTPGFVDMNLANAERDANLVVRTTFNNPQTHDVLGNPVRSDIIIDFTAAPANANQVQYQANERVSPIATASGFMDIQWNPATQQVMYPGMFGQQPGQQHHQKYIARFVMTSLESAGGLTIPAQLLALVSAVQLREGNNWVKAFDPNTGFAGEFDPHDIGAIGIECNFENNPNGIGVRVDTRKEAFKQEHLAVMIGIAFQPGLIMSLDVPECGDSTWYNGVFAASGAGDIGATEAIVAGANRLTNGIFTKYFQNRNTVVVDESNRIHMGYYTDRNGIKKDIRDIDYLTVLNMVGDRDPVVARNWSNTFTQTNVPLNYRLSKRKQIITSLFSDVKFTGFARRVSFDAFFMESLLKAIAEMNLTIRQINPYNDIQSQVRGQSPFASQTLMSADATGIFNRGYQNSNIGQSSRFGIGNRW